MSEAVRKKSKVETNKKSIQAAKENISNYSSRDYASTDQGFYDSHNLIQMRSLIGNQAVQRLTDVEKSHQNGCNCPACSGNGLMRKEETASPLSKTVKQDRYEQADSKDSLQRALGADLDKQSFIDHLVQNKDARQLKDHIPSTGLGRFDAEYRPDLSLLTIRIRVLFDFGDNVPKDGGGKEFQSGAGAWTDQERNTFILGFKAQSESAWSGKYKLACKKAGWEDLAANVQIIMDPARTIQTAHFHHKIAKERSIGTGIGREQLTDRNNRNVGNFIQDDATVGPQKASVCGGIASHDVMRINNIIEASKVNPIRFNNQMNIDNPSKAKLDTMVNMLTRTERPGSVPVPIIATGKNNKRERTFGGANNAITRANNVKTYLESKQTKHPVTTQLFDVILNAAKADAANAKSPANKAHFGGIVNQLNAGRDHRQVELSADQNFKWQGDPYSVLAHEFGHMLGNPDEYFDYGSDAIKDAKVKQLSESGKEEDLVRAKQIERIRATGNQSHSDVQESFADLAIAADQTIPEFGPKTSSIMSAGADVLPVHYVTMWEALGEITKDTLQPSDWQITS